MVTMLERNVEPSTWDQFRLGLSAILPGGVPLGPVAREVGRDLGERASGAAAVVGDFGAELGDRLFDPAQGIVGGEVNVGPWGSGEKQVLPSVMQRIRDLNARVVTPARYQPQTAGPSPAAVASSPIAPVASVPAVPGEVGTPEVPALPGKADKTPKAGKLAAKLGELGDFPEAERLTRLTLERQAEAAANEERMSLMQQEGQLATLASQQKEIARARVSTRDRIASLKAEADKAERLARFAELQPATGFRDSVRMQKGVSLQKAAYLLRKAEAIRQEASGLEGYLGELDPAALDVPMANLRTMIGARKAMFDAGQARVPLLIDATVRAGREEAREKAAQKQAETLSTMPLGELMRMQGELVSAMNNAGEAEAAALQGQLAQVQQTIKARTTGGGAGVDQILAILKQKMAGRAAAGGNGGQ